MKMKWQLALIVGAGLGGLTSANLSFAHEDKKMEAVLGQYLKIQESLAVDSLKGVSQAAQQIEKNADSEEIKSAAEKLASDKTLESAREHFKALSIPMDKWAKVEAPENVDRMNCPMVKAPWLQKHGTVKNPYYGKKMASCGQVQKND